MGSGEWGPLPLFLLPCCALLCCPLSLCLLLYLRLCACSCLIVLLVVLLLVLVTRLHDHARCRCCRDDLALENAIDDVHLRVILVGVLLVLRGVLGGVVRWHLVADGKPPARLPTHENRPARVR